MNNGASHGHVAARAVSLHAAALRMHRSNQEKKRMFARSALPASISALALLSNRWNTSGCEDNEGTSRVRVGIPRLVNLLCLALRSEGYTNSLDIRVIADVLLFAELRGNNQGSVKLINGDLKLNPLSSAKSVVEHETPVSARLNGRQRTGMCVMHDAVDLALEKAAAQGVGIVGMSFYSSATGALGYWSRKIALTGNVGIVMSSCPEMVAPHGSHEAIFGTNPIAIGFPGTLDGKGAPPLVLDMATSSTAWFAVVTAAALGQSLPEGLAYDCEGYLTRDPNAVLQGGALRPFDFSYKGSHLGLMVELLAGALVGAAVENKHSAKNWGSLVVVINPAVLGADPVVLQEKVEALCRRIKNAKRVPATTGDGRLAQKGPVAQGVRGVQEGRIYLPGERGDEMESLALQRGWVEMEEVLLERLEKLAEGHREW